MEETWLDSTFKKIWDFYWTTSSMIQEYDMVADKAKEILGCIVRHSFQ